MEQQDEDEILDFNKPDYVFVPKGYHEWRQKGPYLVCLSCDIQHATWIGVDRLLTGVNEKGEPILKSKKFVAG